MLGVSYGSVLGHLFVCRNRTTVAKLIDYSGVATTRGCSPDASSNSAVPPVLFIHGAHDAALADPRRLELINAYKKRTRVRELVLEQEGHIIRRRRNVDRILRELDAFTSEAFGRTP